MGASTNPLNSITVCVFEEVMDRYNTVLAEVNALKRYIQCFVDADSRAEKALTRWMAFLRSWMDRYRPF